MDMDKIFNRNFLIFGALLVIAAAITSYSLIQGERQMSAGDNLIFHTHEIILEAEQLASHIEGLVSGQRAYIMTGDESFQKEYDKRKADISQALARLTELTQNNPAQQSRLDEMRKHYVNFSQALDERANSVLQTQNREILRDVTLINQLKENILRINNDVMEEEYGLLNRRFDEVNKQKSKYFKSLLVGVVFGSIILLILNAFLLRAQHKRSYAEKSLRGTEERLMLALEGTQDGIYDWDITNDKIFYSKQFFHMLGMNKEAYTGRVEDVKELIHPDDQERVFNYVDQYINGELSEYVQEFRMKHASGRWIWVQSSAKGIFNDEGKAIRLVGAHSDITASVKAQEKLEVEKEEAEEANRAKSDFLAHMSHEIRTPLTAISGIAEILQKKQDNLNDKQIQLVKTLNSSTSSLKELINDILDFSKIENGEIEFDDHNFNLNEVFEETISMMSLKASAMPLNLRMKVVLPLWPTMKTAMALIF